MSFLGSETFSTPQSITECANPTRSLSRTRSPSKNTHICSHFLPRRAANKQITADAMQGMGGGSKRETSCPAPTCCFSYLASAPALFLSPTLPSVCFSPSLADPNPSPNFLLPQTISIRSLCANSRRAWRRVWRAAWGGVVLHWDQNNLFTHFLNVEL